MRYFEKTDRMDAFRHTAFIIDGPLAIFGTRLAQYYVGTEVARLHDKAAGHPAMRKVRALPRSPQRAGLEDKRRSWPAAATTPALAPDIDYIHRHIALRPINRYGSATYRASGALQEQSGPTSVVISPTVNDKGRDPRCVDEDAYPRIGDALDLMDELATHLYRDGFAPLVRAHAHERFRSEPGGESFLRLHE